MPGRVIPFLGVRVTRGITPVEGRRVETSVEGWLCAQFSAINAPEESSQ